MIFLSIRIHKLFNNLNTLSENFNKLFIKYLQTFIDV